MAITAHIVTTPVCVAPVTAHTVTETAHIANIAALVEAVAAHVHPFDPTVTTLDMFCLILRILYVLFFYELSF